MRCKTLLLSICVLFLSGILLYGCSDPPPSSHGSGSSRHEAEEDPIDDPIDDDFMAEEPSDDPATEPPAENTPAAKTPAPTPEAEPPTEKPAQDTPASSRDNTPRVLTPSPSGSIVYENEYASIDASHAEEGYVMVKYLGSNSKVKLMITGPDQSDYTYLLSGRGSYETFPLSCGSGGYKLQVFENAGGDKYALAHSANLNVSISNELKPFLYPNQYVNFQADSRAVSKGSALAKGASTDLEVIENIYHYVTKEIEYDTSKAQSVSYGYLPDIDATMQSGKGICFDYAALMSAMLRSQGIPTKLQVGYSSEAYHAWISTYIKDIGWIDKIIEFDGTSWTLMDPTLAASNDNRSVGKYIGDGSNYVVKYSY